MKGAILAASLAASMATPALACSYSNWNHYEGFFTPSLVELWDEAAAVDWIAVEAGPVNCPTPRRLAEEPDLPVATGVECPGFARLPGDFSGRVLETFKGGSFGRFPLFRRSSSGASRLGFTDPREWPREMQDRQAQDFRRVSSRHGSRRFWDAGRLEFLTDLTDSCGGEPTLEPSLRYLAFRDAGGAVLAVEPVLAGDDPLLQKLRDRRADPAASLREAYPVEDLFRTAAGLVLVKVDRCRGGGRDAESEEAAVEVVRGSAAFLTDTQWSVESDRGVDYQHGPPDARSLRFDDLWDAFAFRDARCPRRGEHVLILRPHFDEPGSESAYGVDRPIRVQANGTVRRADIMTALDLAGPETLSMDQIFQWFEEGRAANPAPSSSGRRRSGSAP